MTQPGEPIDWSKLTERAPGTSGAPQESDAARHKRFMDALGGPVVGESAEVDETGIRPDVSEKIHDALAGGPEPAETRPWIPIDADERLHSAISRYRQDATEALMSTSVLGAPQGLKDGLEQARPRIGSLRQTVSTCNDSLATIERYLFPKDANKRASYDEARLAGHQLFDASDDYRNFRRGVSEDYGHQVGWANKLHEGMAQVDEAATEAKRGVGGVERDYGKHTAAGERAIDLQDGLKKDSKEAGHARHLSQHVRKVLGESPALAKAAAEPDVYGPLQALHTVLQSIGFGDRVSYEQAQNTYAAAKDAIAKVAAAADAVDAEVSGLIGRQTQETEATASRSYIGEIEKCMEALRQSQLLGLSGNTEA